MLDLRLRNVRRTRRIYIRTFTMLSLAAVLLLTGGILARQFLIRSDAASPVQAMTTLAPSPSVTPSPTFLAIAAATHMSSPTPSHSAASSAPHASPIPPGHSIEDGLWQYWDEYVRVEVQRVTGEAVNGIYTAYVAQIELADPSRMQVLFAMDQAGRNYREYTHEMAQRSGAILAINGDYYGYRDSGVIVRNGILYRDTPSGEALAIYQDGRMDVFTEGELDIYSALSDGLLHTYSFGPGLVMDAEMPERYRSSVSKPNPRTAIGMIEPGKYIFAVVDGRERGYSGGMTMDELGQFMLDLGCTEAYNLDGGATSEMCFLGEVINRPSDGGRQTSDILYISALDLPPIPPQE